MNLFSRLLARRLRVAVAAIVVVSCIWAGARLSNLKFKYSSAESNLQKQVMEKNFDVVRARAAPGFARPLFHNWPAPKKKQLSKGKGNVNVNIDASCRRYWRQLGALPYTQLVSPRPGFILEPRIYKKSRWMIGAKKALRKQLRAEGQERALTEADITELEARYDAEARLVSSLEAHFAEHVTHLRVLGRCFWGGPKSEFESESESESGPGARWAVDVESSRAMGVISRLLPWLKEPVDIFGSFPGASKSSRGIVVPIFSSASASASMQIDRVARLVRVLRAQRNMLPIQVVYADSELVSAQRQSFLASVATSDKLGKYRRAYEEAGMDEMGKTGDIDSTDAYAYPKQSLSFLDVSQFVMPDVPISDNLMYFVGVLLSDFVHAIVVTTHTIPMATDLASLFDSKQYRRQGLYFFKARPSLDSRPEPFPHGFFEANELVNRFAAAGPLERAIFGLPNLSNPHTRRVTELGFQRLLDPSMVLFNKQRALVGLLISSVLSSHSVLDPKYSTAGGFNPELIWLGQELAATHDYVDFNQYFASVPGVLTPRANLPPSSVSAELCSSSWAQIAAEDERLVFVTSHQLENSVLPAFAAAVRAKYLVPSGDGENSGEIDDSLARETVDKSFLFTRSVLQPVSIEKPQINKEGQPFVSVEKASDFGSVDDYWCAYDIVGGVNPPDRGLVYNFREKDQRRFLFYLAVWKQVPEDT